jgi:hypothetical protein
MVQWSNEGREAEGQMAKFERVNGETEVEGVDFKFEISDFRGRI